MSYVDRTSDNLGTHIEVLFRFALGHRSGAFDLSLGYVHYSNGKFFLGWHGPNYGENFVTLQVGMGF